jgi:hypothetical protein
MYELASLCQVYYINERVHWRNLVGGLFDNNRKKQRKNPAFLPPDNLSVCDPGFRYPHFYGRKGLDDFFKKKFFACVRKKIHKYGKLPIYAYVWYPSCLKYLDELKPDKIIYHPYDKFTEFGHTGEARKRLSRDERELAKRADAIITPHLKIAELLGHPNSYIVSNGVFSPAFSSVEKYKKRIPPLFSGIPSPRLGYIGGINEKINFQLLLEVARERPDWSVILMGPQQNKSFWQEDIFFQMLKQQPNVHFFEGVNFRDVARYMVWFDIGCMPYSVDGWVSFCQSPLKLYQYWALEKPVVSTPLPFLSHEPGILSISGDSRKWVDVIAWELENDNDLLRKRRKKLAEKNSWKRKAADVFEILRGL